MEPVPYTNRDLQNSLIVARRTICAKIASDTVKATLATAGLLSLFALYTHLKPGRLSTLASGILPPLLFSPWLLCIAPHLDKASRLRYLAQATESVGRSTGSDAAHKKPLQRCAIFLLPKDLERMSFVQLDGVARALSPEEFLTAIARCDASAATSLWRQAFTIRDNRDPSEMGLATTSLARDLNTEEVSVLGTFYYGDSDLCLSDKRRIFSMPLFEQHASAKTARNCADGTVLPNQFIRISHSTRIGCQYSDILYALSPRLWINYLKGS